MGAAMRGNMTNELTIKEAPGRFLPCLTPEMTAWWADASLSLGRALGGGRTDPRVYETIVRTASCVARFAPSDILLPDGRQRATFTMRQMAEALGHDGESTKTVQHALRVLSLDTKATDPVGYRKAYELLNEDRRSVPLLECVEKSSARGKASVWRLVGIEPRTDAVAPSTRTPSGAHKPEVDSPGIVAGNGRTVVGSSESVVGSSESVVGQTASFQTTNQGPTDGATSMNSCEFAGRVNAPKPVPVVGKDEGRQGEATTPLYSSSTTLSFDRRAYNDLVSLFPRGPEKKEEETVAVYRGLLELGYTADGLAEGVRRYFSTPTDEEKSRFPLTFLKDRDLVMRWCKKPEKTLDAAKLRKTKGGDPRWLYVGAQGAFEVKGCPGGCSRERAFEALKSMPGLESLL